MMKPDDMKHDEEEFAEIVSLVSAGDVNEVMPTPSVTGIIVDGGSQKPAGLEDWDDEQPNPAKRSILAWSVGQILAAFVIAMAVLSMYGGGRSRKSARGWVWALSMAVATPLMIGIVFVLGRHLNKGSHEGSRVSAGLPWPVVYGCFMCVWWFVWACVFTFSTPFRPAQEYDYALQWSRHEHWDGYFACWGGLVSAVMTLNAIHRANHEEGASSTTESSDDWLLPRLLFILASSIVHMISALVTHQNAWTVYGLIVSILTITALAGFGILSMRLQKILHLPMILLFSILWTVLAVFTTVFGPYRDGHNGFWSAWCGCLLFGSWLLQVSLPKHLSLLKYLVGQFLAAVVVLAAASKRHHSTRGQHDVRLITGVIASVTMALVVLASWLLVRTASMDNIGHSMGIGNVTLAGVLGCFFFLWWFLWACIFTLLEPFSPGRGTKAYYSDSWNSHDHWNGFFACWGGLACTIMFLQEIARKCTTNLDATTRVDWIVEKVPPLLVSALVQLIADSVELHHAHMPGWAKALCSLIVSILTIITLVAMSFSPLQRRRILQCPVVLFFTLLWTILALLVTLHEPYWNGHVGFWSAWCCCLFFGSWLLESMSIQRLTLTLDVSVDLAWSWW